MRAIFTFCLKDTNEEILDDMRVMKNLRETEKKLNIVCLIHGFGRDKRELTDIPEARAFCQRLIKLGAISYLDLSTQIPATDLREGWGAFEVLLASRGQLRDGLKVTEEMVDGLSEEVMQANERADALIGPMKEAAHD